MLVACVDGAATVTLTDVELENVPLVPVNSMWKVPETPMGAVIAQLVEFVAPFDMMLVGPQVTVHAGVNEVELFVRVIVPVNPFFAVRVIVVEIETPGCALTIVAGFAEMVKLLKVKVRADVV